MQGRLLSRANKYSKLTMLEGSQHSINPTTIAMAIFSTFLFLFAHCLSALVDCSPGPGCIKQLKITWEFRQQFPVFQKIFSHSHCVSNALFSTFCRFVHNSLQENPPQLREWLQKFPLNLKLLYATGPWNLL